jgi:uncharacterized protein (TIGR00251 family)
MTAVEEKDGRVLLRLRVQPRASRNALFREPDGRIRVALMAPPVEGAANKALAEFIAKFLGVPKCAVVLAAGERSRDKTLAISGITRQDMVSKLEQL